MKRKKKGRNSTNPLMDILRFYNLLNNKHIPDVYLRNSRENRLKLLAGIIDTDGCLSNNNKRVEIIQVNPILSKQIVVLSQSLGFITNYKIVERNNVQLPNCNELKKCSDQYRITLSGKRLSEIPTKLIRKQCNNSRPNKNCMLTKINVVPTNIDTYYGFMLDGDHLFVLNDFTLVKNCDQMYCTVCKIAFSWKTGEIENGVIHNPHYFQYQRLLQEQQTEGENMNLAQYAEIDVCGPCGDDNMPNWYLYAGVIKQSLNDGLVTKEEYQFAYDIYRQVNHINNTVNARLREDCNRLQNNEILRANYIMSKISKKTFGTELVLREREFNTKIASLQVYDLLLTVIRECVNRMFTDKTCVSIKESMNHMNRLIRYTNSELARLSYIHNKSVGLYTIKDYWLTTKRFCKNEYIWYKNRTVILVPSTDTKPSMYNTVVNYGLTYARNYMYDCGVEYPLRRMFTLPKLKKRYVIECIKCKQNLTIPYYKGIINNNNNFCSKCIFTQYEDSMIIYGNGCGINIKENLENEKKEIEKLFKNKKLKNFTQTYMDRINNYKFRDRVTNPFLDNPFTKKNK